MSPRAGAKNSGLLAARKVFEPAAEIHHRRNPPHSRPIPVPRYGGIKGPEEAACLADIPLGDEFHASLIDQNAQALAGTDAERDPCLARNDDLIFFRNRDRCHTKPRSIGNS